MALFKHGIISALSSGLYDNLSHYKASRRLAAQPTHSLNAPFLYDITLANSDTNVLTHLTNTAADNYVKDLPSVIDKPDPAPNGQKHDYYSIAAYWWPNPETLSGLPYIRRDCDRNPATELYSAESAQFDKTSMQRMLDIVLSLTFAGHTIDNTAYKTRAADALKHWFLNPKTAMRPNMAYAQMRPGVGKNGTSPQGLIEARDLCLLVDCIQLLKQAEILTDRDITGLKNWATQFLEWTETSHQAQHERRTGNNHGTNHDVLTYSLATLTQDHKRQNAVAARAKLRLRQQIEDDGTQPHELKRPHKFHYCAYNIQSWLLLAVALKPTETNLWDVYGTNGRLITASIQNLMTMYQADPASAATEGFVPQRLLPLLQAVHTNDPALWVDKALQHPDLQNPPPAFHPYTGIPPYWHLMKL